MAKKTISVVVPNYNDSDHVGISLQAICEQSNPPLEIIVVDDGSTDNSIEVIQEMMSKYPAIRLVRNDKNRGTNYTVNRGAALATGEFILLSSANDLILPGLFEKAVNLLEKYPQAGLCCADMYFVNVRDGYTYRNPPDWLAAPGYLSPDELVEVIRTGKTPHPHIYTSIIRRELLPAYQPYRPELEWYADWFCSQVIALRHGCCYIPEPLAKFRWLDRGYFHSGLQNHKLYRKVVSNIVKLLISPEYEDVARLMIRGRCLQFIQIHARTPLVIWQALRGAGKLNNHTTAFFSYITIDYLQEAYGPKAWHAVLQRRLIVPAGQALCNTRGILKNLWDRTYARTFHQYDKYRSLIKQFRLRSQINLVTNSQLFDEDWYLQQYPDVADSGVSPVEHFLAHGAIEYRDPHPLFDTDWYLAQYADVAKSDINPLVHFLLHGAKQGYDPNPLFDCDWYLQHYPRVATSGINPVVHYLSSGADQNYDPGPLFSTKWYVSEHSELSRIGINPLAHYLRRGTAWFERKVPSANDYGSIFRRDSHYSTANQSLVPQDNVSASVNTSKVLLVGHDASATGAPMLLLNLVRCLRESFGVEVTVILLNGGQLESEFIAAAPTEIVANDYGRFKHLISCLWTQGYRWAVCNTVATGKCTEILYQAGFIVISTIHEMSSVIHTLGMEAECITIGKYAHRVLFPADIACRDFERLSGELGARAIIRPQGLFLPRTEIPNAKESVCERLNIPRNSFLAIAVGVGDLRKGLDLYLQLARRVASSDRRFHFLWIGDIAEELAVWFKHDINTELLQQCFHHVPFTRELNLYYEAADIFVLSSREDPFPSVVLDALAHGVPVVAFDKCGGYVELLKSKQNGELVPYADIEAMAGAVQRIVMDEKMVGINSRAPRSKQLVGQFDFRQYAFNLLQLFDPGLQVLDFHKVNQPEIKSPVDSSFVQSC